MNRKQATTGDFEAGFSLLEMLVVLGLLGLIAAVTMPMLRGGAEAGLVERTAFRMAADFMTMRTLAIHDNTETGIDFDLKSNTYWGSTRLAPWSVPAQLEVDVQTPLVATAPRSIVHFQFFPDGSSNGGRILIGHGRNRRTLTIDWLTGQARVSREP